MLPRLVLSFSSSCGWLLEDSVQGTGACVSSRQSRSCPGHEVGVYTLDPGMQVGWLEEVVKAAGAGQLRRGALSFADRVFANEMNSAILETRQACQNNLADHRAQSQEWNVLP